MEGGAHVPVGTEPGARTAQVAVTVWSVQSPSCGRCALSPACREDRTTGEHRPSLHIKEMQTQTSGPASRPPGWQADRLQEEVQERRPAWEVCSC